MPQDRDSGTAAQRWGLAMGKRLAHLLGAKQLRRGSNEVLWNGRTAVIKSCRATNSSFGITAAMLPRLNCALVGIEEEGGGFTVHELPIAAFTTGMRDSRSGKANGSVKLQTRAAVERHGKRVARFTRAEIEAADRPEGFIV